jgi:hypothetical protein
MTLLFTSKKMFGGGRGRFGRKKNVTNSNGLDCPLGVKV